MLPIGYRPDIDGLRTIAIVPVVLFHAGFSQFSGGFVGVDVFFVISGYLITAILLRSMDQGNYSITDFYIRRIKRIFPALLLVIAATTIAAWIFFAPDKLIEYGGSLGSVTIFASNFWFWKSVNYFANNAHVEPLLHTWSLAAEEQFYIFYPILLLMVARTRLNLSVVLISIGLISLGLAVFMLESTPGAAFYLLPTRAWELIIGGLLACGTFPAPRTKWQIHIGAIVGLALIIYSVSVYTSDTSFPGIAAVPPVLGAALVIWTGISREGLIYRLLATTPFVVIGKASYSFYLWHFPIFAFATYLNSGPFDLLTGLILSIISLALSLLTLVMVENRARRLKSSWAYWVPLSLMFVAGIGGLALASGAGFPQRLSAEAVRIADAARDKERHPYQCMSSGDVIVPPVHACKLGTENVEPVAVLWGDSHAMVTATAMEKAARSARGSFLFAATADCPPGLAFDISPIYAPALTTTRSYRFCADYNQQMLDLVKATPSVRSVVISARWTNWRIGASANPAETEVDIRLMDEDGVASSRSDNARIWRAGFKRLIEALRMEGKEVIIVGPLPEPVFDVPQRLFVSRFGVAPKVLPLTQEGFQRRHWQVLAFFEDFEAYKGVHFLWPHRQLCGDDGFCALMDDEGPIYFDHNHLTVNGALKTSEVYAPVFLVTND